MQEEVLEEAAVLEEVVQVVDSEQSLCKSVLTIYQKRHILIAEVV